MWVGGLFFGSAGRATTVEVESRIVDLKPHLAGETLRDRPDVGLVNLLDPTAMRAGEVMVMLGKARHVGIDVTIQLQAAGNSSFDKRLEGAKDRGPSDAWLPLAEPAIELVGGQLSPIGSQCVGHQQALACDTLSRRR